MAGKPVDPLTVLQNAAKKAIVAGGETIRQDLKQQASQGLQGFFAKLNPGQGEAVGGKPIQSTFDETEPRTPMQGHMRDDDEDDDTPEPGEAPYQTFSSSKQDADENLELAVAAWRMFTPADDAWIVAQHEPSGNSFAGRLSDLNRLVREYRQNEDDWQVWYGFEGEDEDEETIWDLPCSATARATARRILSRVLMDEYDEKAREYAREHLGDKATGVAHVAIPGITKPLVTFGVCRGVAYTASKEGKLDHYFHVSGEETPGSFPILFKLDDNTAVIHNPAGLFDKDGGWMIG